MNVEYADASTLLKEALERKEIARERARDLSYGQKIAVVERMFNAGRGFGRLREQERRAKESVGMVTYGTPG